MSRFDEMMRLRFDERKTLEEIGREFNISRERVRQIIGNTGYILREELEIRNEKISSSNETTPALAKKYGLTESRISTIRNGTHHLIEGGYRQKGEMVERFVSQMLLENGIHNELMPTSHPFDILALNNVRVDVKGAFKTTCTGELKSPQWHFCLQKGKRGQYCDVFVCVVWKTKDCFIIPDSVLSKNQQDLFFCHPTLRPEIGKYQKYLNRWDLIEGISCDKEQSEKISA